MNNSKRTLTQRLIDAHNHFSDKPFIWFPFYFLKPKPYQRIGLRRIFIMTFFFSSYGIFFLYLKYLIFRESFDGYLQATVFVPIGFFLWFKLVTSRLWNLRAEGLKRERQQV